MRCTNSNVHGKDWSSSNTSNSRHSSPCTQGASGGEPLYAHKNTKHAAAPLGTGGSFGNWNKLGFAVSLASGLTFVSTFCQYFFKTEVFWFFFVRIRREIQLIFAR